MPAALTKLRVTQKLLIVVTLIVAGFLLFNLLISRYVLGNHALKAADQLAFSILDRTDRQIVQVFSDFEKLIKGMAGTRAVRNLELDDLQDLFLPQVLVRQPYLNGIYLGTADGAMHGWGHGAGYIDTRPILPPGYDPRERPWYKLAALAGGFAVTEPYRYANVDVMGITCVLPLYDEDHLLVAVLGMDIWVDSLVNILEDFDLPMNAKVAILDGNGNIIASQLNGELDFSREVTAIDFSQHTSPPVIYEGAFLSGYAGESYRIIYRKLDSYKLTVVAAIPYDTILSETRGLVQIVSLLYLILIMSMVLVVSAITGRIVVAPLNYMVSVVDRKKNGELGARILLRNRDEF
ncbi:MAG: cache domain-containing protein, partial [Spirochaetes bacterium]|nr:cache domain-containing protein [Spirochaetota bacterium]